MCWKGFIDCWFLCMAFQKIIDWCRETEVPVQKHTYNASSWCLKGQFTQKWKFCHPLLSLKYFQTCMNVFVLNTKEDILKNVWNRAVLDHSIFFYCGSQWCPKQPDYKLSSEYLPLCSAEQTHSYRSGNTCGWVNDDIISIFGWTIPLI